MPNTATFSKTKSVTVGILDITYSPYEREEEMEPLPAKEDSGCLLLRPLLLLLLLLLVGYVTLKEWFGSS